MLNVTDAAKKKMQEYLASEQKCLGVRLAIVGRGPFGFEYQLGLVKEGEAPAGDEIIAADGLSLYVDSASVPNLRGSTIDFVAEGMESGFKIDNPNPLWSDPTALAVQHVLDTEINPSVAGHGGFVALLDVQGDTAYVALAGGCHGCGMANVTLKQGVEVAIKRAVPEIAHVLDTTDHAAGTNPYYQPAKGCQSPLA